MRLVASLAPLTDADAPAPAPARSAPQGGRPHAHGGGAPPSTAAVPRAAAAADIAAEIAQMTQSAQLAQRERAVTQITQLASAPPPAHSEVPGAAQPVAACGGAACTDTTCGIYAEMGWSEDTGWAAKHRAYLQAEGRVEAGRVGTGRVQAGRARPSSAAARCARAGAMQTSSSAPRLGASLKTAPWLVSGSGVLNKELYRLPVELSSAPVLRVPSATVQRPVYRTS